MLSNTERELIDDLYDVYDLIELLDISATDIIDAFDYKILENEEIMAKVTGEIS